MTNRAFHSVPVADGSTMDIWVTFPEEGIRRPILLLLHEAFGINTYIRSVAERLCMAGYAVLAPDLFHRSGRLVQLPYTSPTTSTPYIESVTDDGLFQDLQACLGLIRSAGNIERRRIGALGFGLGGRCACLANCILPISAGVSYYACDIEKPREVLELQSPHLFFWAGHNSFEVRRREDFVDCISAGRYFTSVSISYAEPGFHCDERSSYHPLAAREAWMHTLAFLDYLLK